tara:strand:+ start:1389 stop:1778 length:390 start_codon:yes stop_codon:yes gene_type:complete
MISPRKKIDINKYLLTDEFTEEGLIKIISTDDNTKCIKSNNNKNSKSNKKNKDVDFNLDYNSSKKKEKKRKNNDSNVEFIIVEDENDEKKLVINLELKLNESIEGTELIKIDFEINQDIYLDLIKELLK